MRCWKASVSASASAAGIANGATTATPRKPATARAATGALKRDQRETEFVFTADTM